MEEGKACTQETLGLSLNKVPLNKVPQTPKLEKQHAVLVRKEIKDT